MLQYYLRKKASAFQRKKHNTGSVNKEEALHLQTNSEFVQN